MTTIKPFMTYITVQGVDHEDHVVETETPPPFIMALIGAKEADFQELQGMGAGVIIDVGQLIEHLKPGFKVYYDARYARRIDDIWVVDARAVMAYEEI